MGFYLVHDAIHGHVFYSNCSKIIFNNVGRFETLYGI